MSTKYPPLNTKYQHTAEWGVISYYHLTGQFRYYYSRQPFACVINWTTDRLTCAEIAGDIDEANWISAELARLKLIGDSYET